MKYIELKKNDATNNAHVARSQYVSDRVGTSRFDVRIETEDGIDNLHPVRTQHNEIERALFAEYDETLLDNLVNEAIESGDYASVKYPENECCPGCGGFMGCACDEMAQVQP